MGKIQGYNLIRNSKLRHKQMRYLMDNMKEPNLSRLSFASCNTLNNTFNTNGSILDTAAITYRIMNHQGFGDGATRTSDSQPTFGSVANFMCSIQDYLPQDLRSATPSHKLWNRTSFRENSETEILSDETRELLEEMCQWLMSMKYKIEDQLTSNYFIDGKANVLEILKRRYKDQWSERTEQNVDANVNGDNKLQIVFEDL